MPPVPVLAVSAVGLVLLVVLALVGLLVLGGIVASGRAARQREAHGRAEVARADADLAAARADDNGWDAEPMEAAARRAWEAERGAEPISAVHLVQVVDRPGTDADEAVYRVAGAGGRTHDIRLRRVDGRWTA